MERFIHQKELLENLKDIPELTRQKRNIEILQKPNYVIPLMFSMYQNAKVREVRKNMIWQHFLFYRLLELIEQRRLSLYQLFVSKMEYMKMKIDGKEITEEEFASLKERVADLKKAVFGRNTSAICQSRFRFWRDLFCWRHWEILSFGMERIPYQS